MKNKIVYLVAVFFLISGFFIVKDYGITWDEPENFGIGHKYLHFYFTGHLDFKDNTPQAKDHPDFYNFFVKNEPNQVWSFANILSAITCFVFFEKLQILDPISAHHMIIPILMTGFLLIFYGFIKRHFGNLVAILSVLFLITYPRLFGHTFNNIKDVPELIFFSSTILFFVDWVLSRKTKYLFLSSLFFGFALSTKMDAVLIPVILFIWITYCFISGRHVGLPLHNKKHLFLTLISVVIFFLSYPPLFFSERFVFLRKMIGYAYKMGINKSISWNFYALAQIFYVTPVLMLGLFVLGLVWGFKNIKTNRLFTLFLIWLLFPVLRHCLPGAFHYDGVRHFLVFIVPFSFFAAIGVDYLIKNSKVLGISTCILALIINIFWLYHLHPYQTTYFNLLVGGLKGAQEKKIEYSFDYWLNSYREASVWLNNNAKPNSFYIAYPYQELFSYYPLRQDIKPTTLENISPNTYIIFVPREIKGWDNIQNFIKNSKLVYQINRQGGEVLSIYYFLQ
jgi:hypothetical protein